MIQVSVQVAVTLVLAFLGMVFAFGKILVQQIEKRFVESQQSQAEAHARQMTALERALQAEASRVSALTDQLNAFNSALPLQYVRREDWIRFSATIDHKLDRLADIITMRNPQ